MSFSLLNCCWTIKDIDKYFFRFLFYCLKKNKESKKKIKEEKVWCLPGYILESDRWESGLEPSPIGIVPIRVVTLPGYQLIGLVALQALLFIRSKYFALYTSKKLRQGTWANVKNQLNCNGWSDSQCKSASIIRLQIIEMFICHNSKNISFK